MVTSWSYIAVTCLTVWARCEFYLFSLEQKATVSALTVTSKSFPDGWVAFVECHISQFLSRYEYLMSHEAWSMEMRRLPMMLSRRIGLAFRMSRTFIPVH